MGRRSMGKYQNGNGHSYQDDLPERGPGAMKFNWRIDKRKVNRWHLNATTFCLPCAEFSRNCTNFNYALMMCQRNWSRKNCSNMKLIFLFLSQWNHWSTGAMLRSRESFSALDSPSFLPCRCSRLSASLHTCRSWHSLPPFHSESTKRSCQQFKRHPRDIHSSEFISISNVCIDRF